MTHERLQVKTVGTKNPVLILFLFFLLLLFLWRCVLEDHIAIWPAAHFECMLIVKCRCWYVLGGRMRV